MPQDFWPWHIMFKFCDPIENTSNRNLKSVFPLTEANGIIIQQAAMQIPKNLFSAPIAQVTGGYICVCARVHMQIWPLFVSQELRDGLDWTLVRAGRHQVLTSRKKPSPLTTPYPSLSRLLRSRPVEWQVFWKLSLQLVLDLKSIAWRSNVHQSKSIYCSLIDSNVGGHQS